MLKGGFEMGNLWYNEPKTLDVAFDVIGDIVLSAASQQYGGFTVPNIELILEPYAEKSYEAVHRITAGRHIVNINISVTACLYFFRCHEKFLIEFFI